MSTSASKSLTPQRKHRKLLKDGSGSEVWPEAIERIFVDGLRRYLDSPWASNSRGRSRWRNQYLVDFLQKAGITRSKKQVASHIQVLRNMWKGQPEYQLVAGGDELFDGLGSPTGSPVKSEELDSPSSLMTFDFSDEAETLSSNSSPSFSPPDLAADIPLFKVEHHQGFDSPLSASGSITSPLSHRQLSKQVHQPHPRSPLPKHAWSPQPFQSNRVSVLSLQADGMMPFGVTLAALVPPGTAPACLLKIRLTVPSIHDTRSPPTFHGFSGTISIANVWSACAKCTTRVYANGVCLTSEMGAIEATNIDTGVVRAVLPESSLTRCRWLEPNVQTTIHQEILVDNETLLSVVYHLDRRVATGMPSAELLGYQTYRMEKQSSQQSQQQQQPPLAPAQTHINSTHHLAHYARPSTLSYALGQ